MIYCKTCKFLTQPIPYQDAVGITYSPFKCDCLSNKEIITDWYGNDSVKYLQTPHEKNAANDCACFEEPAPIEPTPEIPANPEGV